MRPIVTVRVQRGLPVCRSVMIEIPALWQLTISYKKCSCMLVGRHTYNVTCNFRLNGDPFKVVNNSKDFGGNC